MTRVRWLGMGILAMALSGCCTLAELPLVRHLFDRTPEAVVIDESMSVSDSVILPHGPIIAAPPGHPHLAPAVPAPGSPAEIGPPPNKVLPPPPPPPNLVQPQPAARPMPASPSSLPTK